MNKMFMTGRLTNEPEYSRDRNGGAICRFNIAVNRIFRREGEADADFFPCVAFGKIADVMERCLVSKGTKLLITAEARNNNYEKDGVMHYGFQFRVVDLEFCEKKSSASQVNPNSGMADHMGGFVPVDDMDLPF